MKTFLVIRTYGGAITDEVYTFSSLEDAMTHIAEVKEDAASDFDEATDDIAVFSVDLEWTGVERVDR